MRKIALLAFGIVVLTGCVAPNPPDAPPAEAWREKLACQISLYDNEGC